MSSLRIFACMRQTEMVSLEFESLAVDKVRVHPHEVTMKYRSIHI